MNFSIEPAAHSFGRAEAMVYPCIDPLKRGALMKNGALCMLAALALKGPLHAADAPWRPDQAAFLETFRKLVETNGRTGLWRGYLP